MTVVHLHADDDEGVVPDAGGAFPPPPAAAVQEDGRPTANRRKDRPVRVGPGQQRSTSRLLLIGGSVLAAAGFAFAISYDQGFNQVAVPSDVMNSGQQTHSLPPGEADLTGNERSEPVDLATSVHEQPHVSGPPAPSSDLLFQEMIERLERIETVAKKAVDKPSLSAEISKAVMPLVDRLSALENEVRDLKKIRPSPQQPRMPASRAPVPATAAPVNLAPPTTAVPCVIRGWSFVGTHRNLVWLQRDGTSSPIRYALGETVQALGRLMEVKQDGAGQWYVDVNGGSGSCKISQAVR